MSDDLKTAQLLTDAHLVLEYAVRAGRLPDEALPKALQALESAPPESRAQAIPPLSSALNDAVAAIAPMTLIELRAGRNPFDPSKQGHVGMLQATFCIVTIILTLVVAKTTEHLHRQDTALKALQQLREIHPLEKLNALRKLVRFDEALGKQDGVRYDQYHRAITELREIQDRVSGLGTLLPAAEGGWLTKIFDPAPASANTYSPDEAAHLQVQANRPRGQPAAPPDQAKDVPQSFTQEDGCQVGSQDDALKNYPSWLQQVITDSVEELCFSKNLNLLMAVPDTAAFYRLQGNIAALNGWVLPFLYGLLGALVFVMRRLLDPRTPVMGLLDSIVRVALGGLAGVFIGWFWIPTAFQAGDVANISSIPFGLAFLAGFSIDILFKILDRLSDTVSTPAAAKAG